MFENNTQDNKFPKTLEIRNTEDGMIWQIYHINNLKEAEILSINAAKNGFYSRRVVDFRKEEEETFPDWRTHCCESLKAVLS